MTKGIYLFWDNKYEQVIYAGRFTGKQRIKDHFSPSKKHQQKINAYVQNHPDRIESVIFCEFDDISNDDLNQLEKETIKLFKLNKYKYPDNFVFNFNDGGDGNCGWTPSKETRKKLSAAHTGKTLSEEHKKKISKSKKGTKLTTEHRKKISKNHPDQSGENNPSWKDYPRIIKNGKNKYGNQQYRIIYNGKIFTSSVDKKKLYVRWYSEYPDIELIDETN